VDESIFYFWILGIPIIVLLVYSKTMKNIILLNTANIKNEKKSIDHMIYLTSLIMWYKTNQDIKLVLNGYFEYHKFICPNPECISKKESFYTNKSAKLL
jgi:aspartate carbamoyltransferase regulatory subunit